MNEKKSPIKGTRAKDDCNSERTKILYGRDWRGNIFLGKEIRHMSYICATLT